MEEALFDRLWEETTARIRGLKVREEGVIFGHFTCVCIAYV